MLDLSSLKHPMFVVSLGGLVRRTSHVILGGRQVECEPTIKTYLSGTIGLVHPKLLEGLKRARLKENRVWTVSAGTPGARIDEQENPVGVLILAPELGHFSERTRDFTQARMVRFDASALLPVEARGIRNMVREIRTLCTNKEYFPDGPTCYGIDVIKSQLWFLRIAAMVYADTPEAICWC